MKFTEEKLEQDFVELIAQEEIPHVLGKTISRNTEEVFLKDDLKVYLQNRYKKEGITDSKMDYAEIKEYFAKKRSKNRIMPSN